MLTFTRRQALKGMAGMGVALVAAACGGGAPAAPKPGATEAPAPAPAAEQVTLRWDVSDATDVPTMLKMGAQAAALFAQKFPNVTVKPEPPPDNAQQQLLTEMVAGNAPDIIGYCCEYLPFWAGKGQLLKLDPFIDKDITPEQIKDYPAPHWNAFSNPRVGRYAMPMYMGTIVLYYNKDMFDAAGVAYPDDTWDWNLQGTGKYEEALKKLSNPDKKVWGGRIGDGMDRMQQKIAGNGGHWVDPNDDMKAAFDQPAATGALQWLYDRIWKDNSVIRDTAREGANWETLMGNGRIAMYENGDWQLDPMVKTATGKYKWDVAPLPKGPVARNSLATTDGWAIWKGSKHPNEGWEFLKFLQSDEWNDLLITVALLRPSRVSLFDKWLTSTQKAVPALADKNLKVFGDAVPYTTPLELFQFDAEALEIINASIRDAVIRTNKSGSDLAAVCKDVAAKVNAAEAKAKAAAS